MLSILFVKTVLKPSSEKPVREAEKKWLPAASDAGYSNNSSEMTEKDNATDTEHRRDGDIEATVAIEKYRVRAV